VDAEQWELIAPDGRDEWEKRFDDYDWRECEEFDRLAEQREKLSKGRAILAFCEAKWAEEKVSKGWWNVHGPQRQFKQKRYQKKDPALPADRKEDVPGQAEGDVGSGRSAA
jgi:hypothetical protein